jgi:hypothetical protein
MKTGKLAGTFLAILISFGLIFSACTKSGLNSGQGLEVYLTDGPADLKEVWLNIQKVEAKVDNDHDDDDRYGINDDDDDDHMRRRDDYGEWVDLNMSPGLINVLELRNGAERLIASSSNIKGRVRKLRITLGDNNYVVLESGDKLPLTLLNQIQKMIYVKLFDEHRGRGRSGQIAVRIDFDLGSSVLFLNGKYWLKPFVRPFCNENFGEVEGVVLPKAAKAVVRISNNAGFNAVALPNYDGKYKIRGLKEGTYTVTFQGLSPFKEKIIENVKVSKGETTKLATVTLQQ